VQCDVGQVRWAAAFGARVAGSSCARYGGRAFARANSCATGEDSHDAAALSPRAAAAFCR
jgi:hypothetical protein